MYKLAIFYSLLFLLAGCFDSGKSVVVKNYQEKFPHGLNQTAISFMYEDFGGLSISTLQTNALPWKLVQVAMLLRAIEVNHEQLPLHQSSMPSLLKKYGFLFPKQVLNWDNSENYDQVKGKNPIGMTTGFLQSNKASRVLYKIEAANITCAACHSGQTYDAQGLPTNIIQLGRPNTSLNVEEYTKEVYASFLYAVNVKSREEMLSAMKTIFPEISDAEYATYKLGWPFIKKKVNDLRKKYGRASPYPHGGPGLSNGIGSVKMILKSEEFKGYDAEEARFVSIPDISKVKFKTALLADGTYINRRRTQRFEETFANNISSAHIDELAEVTSFFLVPVMGLNPSKIPESFPKVKAILHFLDNYSTQSFPGKIKHSLAKAGAKVFENRCASCHGSYSNDDKPQLNSFTNQLVKHEVLGTDQSRAKFDHAEETKRAMLKTAMGKTIIPMDTGGYVAPILSGLWASAPYMHNGSVPTLWHFMRPSLRPKTFPSGGHALDFEKVGVGYPDGFKPWAITNEYDTSLPGKSNKGHEFPFDQMSEVEKNAVLEYLKLL